MKKIYLLFAAACIALLSSCGGDKEKYQPDTPNKPVTPSITGDGWAALADSTTYVLVNSYLDKTRGTFWGSVRNAFNNTDYLYWQQAYAMDVLTASYQRIKSSNPSLAAEYETYFQKFYANGANNYNRSHKDEGEYGRFFNDWTDDMAWIGLTLMHITEALGDDRYADTAKDIFDKYIWTRSTRSDKGVCLPWTNHKEDERNFNACTNTPACLLAAKLCEKYGDGKYLDIAENLFEFNVKNMNADGQRVEDPALTYTQGTFAEGARILYHLTGSKSYMQKAATVLTYAFTGNACTHNGILRHEGTSDDQSIFKAGLIPYAVNFVLDPAADSHSAASIREKLLQNARTLNKSLLKSSFPNMYCNYYWGDVLAPSDLVSMGAHASGAALMEGVARMTAKQ